MQATTIKIENPLLNELKKYSPKNESLSSFIREILEKDIQRRKMIEAAETYARFLAENPSEQEWLNEWEEANLAQDPKITSKKKKVEKS